MRQTHQSIDKLLPHTSRWLQTRAMGSATLLAFDEPTWREVNVCIEHFPILVRWASSEWVGITLRIRSWTAMQDPRPSHPTKPVPQNSGEAVKTVKSVFGLEQYLLSWWSLIKRGSYSSLCMIRTLNTSLRRLSGLIVYVSSIFQSQKWLIVHRDSMKRIQWYYAPPTLDHYRA